MFWYKYEFEVYIKMNQSKQQGDQLGAQQSYVQNKNKNQGDQKQSQKYKTKTELRKQIFILL